MEKVGRKAGLSTISISILHMMGLYQAALPQLNIKKLTRFLGKIYQGYRRDVEYHNDIHSADVL